MRSVSGVTRNEISRTMFPFTRTRPSATSFSPCEREQWPSFDRARAMLTFPGDPGGCWTGFFIEHEYWPATLHRRTLMSLGRSLCLILLAGAVAQTVGRGPVPNAPSAGFERREQARIRAHFDT